MPGERCRIGPRSVAARLECSTPASFAPGLAAAASPKATGVPVGPLESAPHAWTPAPQRMEGSGVETRLSSYSDSTRLAKLGVGGAAHASRCASSLEQRPSRDRDALRIASPRADASPVAAAASTHSRASSASASAYEIKAIASAAMPRHGAACGGMAAIRRRSLLHESIVRDAGKASACGVSTKRGGGAAAWRYGSGGSGLRARGDGDVRSLLETSTRGASPSRAPAGGCAEDRSSMHSLSCDRRLSTDCLDFVCLGRCAPPAAPPGWTSAQGFIS
mmetsp:Transcript_6230/g.19965  ORF Transcript_6230/g.19965 Transcript_6230/m.19965 type:complete len:277 (-) Transcript_6230:43-873(-)